MWHTEVESLLVLKNNRGVEGNRVRHMDYGVQINKLMYTRLLKVKISPCSAHLMSWSVRRVLRRSGRIRASVHQIRKDDSIRKQRVKAVDLFS